MDADRLKPIGISDYTGLALDWQGLGELALIVVAVSAMLICIMVFRHQRRIEKSWEESVQALTSYLDSLSTNATRVEGRLSSVEADAATLMQEQRELEASAPTKDNVRHAITLVERGWKADDLVDACGLTRTEADLVCLLHGAGAKKPNGLHAKHRN